MLVNSGTKRKTERKSKSINLCQNGAWSLEQRTGCMPVRTGTQHEADVIVTGDSGRKKAEAGWDGS